MLFMSLQQLRGVIIYDAVMNLDATPTGFMEICFLGIYQQRQLTMQVDRMKKHSRTGRRKDWPTVHKTAGRRIEEHHYNGSMSFKNSLQWICFLFGRQ